MYLNAKGLLLASFPTAFTSLRFSVKVHILEGRLSILQCF